MNSSGISGKKSVYITVVLFLTMFVGGFGMYQLGAVPTQVYERLNLTDSQFSSIMTASMVPSIFLSIVSGTLADRLGIKKVLSACFIIMTLGYVIRPLAGSYGLMFFTMMLGGFTTMVVTGNLSKIAASLFQPKQIVAAVGAIMMGSTASMAASYLTASLFPNLDVAFWTVGVLSVVVTVIWIVTVRESDFRTESRQKTDSTVKEALSASLHSRGVWLTGISLALMMGGATVVTNFQVKSLTTIFAMTEAEAGTYGTVLTVGAVLGTFLIPIAVSGRKNLRMITFAIGLISGISMFFMLSGSAAARYVSAFLNGSLRSGILALLISYPVMFREIGPRYAGTAGGVVATLELLGAFVLPTYLVIPICGDNYAAYFTVGGILILVSAVCALMVSPQQGGAE